MRNGDVPNHQTDGHNASAVALHQRGGRAAAMISRSGEQPFEAGELDKYLVYLAHLDMALPLKVELIRSLRVIMRSFVDRAFGDDPVQLAGNKRRNKSNTGENGDVISSPPTRNNPDNLTSGFRRIAEPCEEKETDR